MKGRIKKRIQGGSAPVPGYERNVIYGKVYIFYGNKFFYIDAFNYFIFVVEKIANGETRHSSGMRTAKSMEDKENWEKANLLTGGYAVRLGIGLIFFVILIIYIRILPIERNSLLISTFNIISLIVMTAYINKKL